MSVVFILTMKVNGIHNNIFGPHWLSLFKQQTFLIQPKKSSKQVCNLVKSTDFGTSQYWKFPGSIWKLRLSADL